MSLDSASSTSITEVIRSDTWTELEGKRRQRNRNWATILLLIAGAGTVGIASVTSGIIAEILLIDSIALFGGSVAVFFGVSYENKHPIDSVKLEGKCIRLSDGTGRIRTIEWNDPKLDIRLRAQTYPQETEAKNTLEARAGLVLIQAPITQVGATMIMDQAQRRGLNISKRTYLDGTMTRIRRLG